MVRLRTDADKTHGAMIKLLSWTLIALACILAVATLCEFGRKKKTKDLIIAIVMILIAILSGYRMFQ